MSKPKIFMVETREDGSSNLTYRFFLSLEHANKFKEKHQSNGPFEFLEGEEYVKNNFDDDHIRFIHKSLHIRKLF